MHSSISRSGHPWDCSQRRSSRFFLLLQDNRPLLVYTRPDKVFPVFYLTLPSMPGFVNLASSFLWIVQSIKFPPVLFFTLTLDFILALSVSADRFNALMSVTCKFSKRITLIKGMDTWSAEQWGHAFFKHLDLIDWGLPDELITDRNTKFLSAFWITLFPKLGVKLLYSIAYHPQIDGSSERTNQTFEIALRFFVHALEDLSYWPEVLPHIQSILNNTSSSITGKTPHEIAYGFLPRRPLDLISFSSLSDTYIARADVADAISFALANPKAHYDRKHQPLYINVGD